MFTIFFGEDLNASATVPLANTPNATAAELAFKSGLNNISTENFEAKTTGATAPLALTFTGAGAPLTATLTGSGSVFAAAPGSTNGVGRYSVPSASSSKWWEAQAGASFVNFVVTLAQDTAAFGFYGVDVGDFGGQLRVELRDGAGTTVQTFVVPNTIGASGSTDGSVLFFGAFTSAPGEVFRSIHFSSTGSSADIFAFDQFTIAELAQVGPPAQLDFWPGRCFPWPAGVPQ